ncbi:sugar transferase [Ichthyenterobacterium magnum]|uniref:Lipopolysaccharide/colanic/teichoic acid biosynthesis glycosyltransferase n=1 Tax=Ichthyenterobacterium magnum TaxID=1230530 RepID=A0A420DV53_9FLAO|nr:sugar transferase [Ichthyenterobacterium magnum]RKE98007.1 lipopolysaccharide/colanic/teichoic acid biosynthesis glycosyltransferase [Ichthyenterobacterium magnum]
MITSKELSLKRTFDLVLSLLLLPLLLLPIFLLVFIATLDTRQFGLFMQTRVGQHGKLFKILKIRTLKKGKHLLGTLASRATTIGYFLRTSKLDELPQLFNVILGDMSFVGPRPDLQGFADILKGQDRVILKVKPGITGPATLKYKDEEYILSQQLDPETYNRTIIWTDKVEINKKYVQNWSFYLDLKYILKSIVN